MIKYFNRERMTWVTLLCDHGNYDCAVCGEIIVNLMPDTEDKK